VIRFDKLVVGPSAGMVKTLPDVWRFCATPATRITVGSMTTLERVGNTPVPPGDVYFYDDDTGESGNALGLPNMGKEKYREVLPGMVQAARAAGKELWVSIVGETIEEIIELVAFCFACGVDGVEINLACPNVHDKGAQKPLMCQDVELVEEIFHKLRRVRFAGRRIGVKIAPTTDQQLLADFSRLANTYPMITDIMATNTRGGQRFVRDGIDKIAFRPPGSDKVIHVGGQAGAPLHDEAVSVVRTLRKHLNSGVRSTADFRSR